MNLGFPYPHPVVRPAPVQRALDVVGGFTCGANCRVYGSVWPYHLAGIPLPASSDVDMQIDYATWKQIPSDVKRKFTIHPPHLRYLKACWQAKEGKRPNHGLVGQDGLPLGNIWVLKSSSALTQHIGAPLELIVSNTLLNPQTMNQGISVHLFNMFDDGKTLWVTQNALNDLHNKELTTAPIAWADQYRRSHDHQMKHAARMGWACRIAPENLCFFDLA
ncbi:MAG: hypothetical protein WAZ18_04275 [Alphaproteobacteria bacterium]